MKSLRPLNEIRPFFIIFVFTLLLIPVQAVRGQAQSVASLLEEEYWQQRVDVVIDATLDPDEHILTGSERISYTNNSPDTLFEFYLHLYPNAYRDRDSQMIRDYHPGTKFFIIGLSESRRGWMDVSKLSVDGRDIDFIVEGTILEASFPRPLPPGGRTTIEVDFTEKIRKTLGRSGYTGQHYDMAQWYPKMAVYDKLGWHPDQFRIGEFYGEFGDYDVSITLPDDYVVAATGICVSGDPGWKEDRGEGSGSAGEKGSEGLSAGGRKTVRFRAEMVHDFAWCADPDFIVESTVYNDVKIMSFYRSWNRSWADSVLARGVRAVRWLEDFVGPFEYPGISIVDSPIHGGMEYPMLVMNNTPGMSLILHEIGHNYFYAILANDERDEAWMDEGFTQFQTFTHAERRGGGHGHGRGHSVPRGKSIWEGIAAPVIETHRAGYAERVATPHHEFKNGARLPLYLKAPLFLRALKYVVGDEKFEEIIRLYFERWKFKHVDEGAFLDVCEEVSGMELDEIFKQWLHTTKYCDYSIEEFESEPAGEKYRTSVRIERKGEMIMPITLMFRFSSGNSESRRVDGMLRTIRKDFTFDDKPVSVSINPANEILDIYQRDNFKPRKWGLAIDNPLEKDYPQDSYQFRLLPVGYYNDEDGGVFGLRLKGGYAGRYKRFTLQQAYGAESEAYHIYADFKHPLGYLGRDAELALRGYYREGRQGGSINIDKALRKSYSDELPKHLSLWLVYQEMTDSSYVYPWEYDEGINFRGGLSYTLYPKSDLFASSLGFSFDRSIWGSDFNYERVTVDAKIWPVRRFPLPVRPRVRFFLGHTSIDPPQQEKFNFSGAGALKREDYFWLRSVGAFWEGDYKNMRVTGGPNLRGYFDGSFNFTRVFSSNAELGLPFPIPMSRKLSRMAGQELYLFYDWGKVYNDNPINGVAPWSRAGLDPDVLKGFISDFGIGIRLFGFSAEFPVYLSHPSIVGEGEKWDLRWTVTVGTLF